MSLQLKAALHVETAANTAGVITIPAPAGGARPIKKIQWSYSETPTGGALTITENGVQVHKDYIIAGGKGFTEFPDEGVISSDPSQPLVVTLAAGGGTAKGCMTIH